ncbi:protein phosphatase 2C domain-containing protein [Arthrobacter gandavensis]|uniref:protein phosphatase 2C domain-containing protein n=1 Tax=Arthrobacter gandavensis TaxID=169960 RepID=UPI00188EEA42|nr:protein phosphatase 2C domain-containing protein [Arthrobacter gandavensis]MBF4992924.1 protein phosphatase 2C domain-containing protein [Arthrobacter gandavensis]
MPTSWSHSVRVQTEGDGHVSEDSCGYADASAWVIDGATSLLPELDLPGASNPSWYARTLDLLLAESADAKPGPDAGSEAGGVLAEALRRVDRVAQERAGSEHTRFPSAALALAQLTAGGVDVMVLADCHAAVELEDGSVVHVTSEPADLRVHREHPADPDQARELLRRDRELRNTPGRLWVARREPEAVQHAHLVRLPAVKRVVLASDGAWRAVDLGLVDSPSGFLRAASTPVGAQQLLLELRRRQEAIGEKADDATILTVVPDA